MSSKRQRICLLVGASVGLSAAGARDALADPFQVSYTDGGSWNTLYAQGFSPSLMPNPNPALAAGDAVLLDQFQFFKSGNTDAASNIRLAILNNIYTNLQGLNTSSASVVGLSTNTVASTSSIATGAPITFDFDNLSLTYGSDYGAVFVNVGNGGELTPVLVSALHTNYTDAGGGDYHPQTNYGTETQYQYTTSNFINTNEFGSFFAAFSYAGDANFRAFLLTPTSGGSTWNASGSGVWSAAGNWTGGVPNAPGAAATFGAAAAGGATVTADIGVTVGSITFDNSTGSYTIDGTNLVTLDATSGPASVAALAGTHAVAAPLAPADETDFAVASGAELNVSDLRASTVTLHKSGAGTLTVNNVRAGALDVAAGAVKLIPNSGPAGMSKVASLTIASGATLDLGANKLITDTPAGAATDGVYSGVQGEVQRAYNFGAWDQPGLTTSQENAGQNAGPLSGTTTIGVATAEQVLFIGPTETTLFMGQTVTGASTIAMYTYAGDVNLDGLVDGADYGTLDNWIQFPGTSGYANGDVNYDGVIDGADYGVLDNTIQLQGAPIPGVNGAAALDAVSAVPEPSACGFALLGAAALVTRRRRRFVAFSKRQCAFSQAGDHGVV